MSHPNPACLASAVAAANAAGTLIREHVGNVGYREKKRADLVTETDTAAEELIRTHLLNDFPDYAFLGEESANEEIDVDRPTWIVDPIDGTTNFVHAYPMFCVSIALALGDEPLVGVIYNPVSDEMFTAVRGGGAFLNDRPLATSTVDSLAEALVAVSLPTDIRPDSEPLRALINVIPHAQAVRRSGSTALNLAFLAAGRLDAMWGHNTKAWDIAAGVLLVREAGGMVTSLDGSPLSLRRPTLVAGANETMHGETLRFLQRKDEVPR